MATTTQPKPVVVPTVATLARLLAGGVEPEPYHQHLAHVGLAAIRPRCRRVTIEPGGIERPPIIEAHRHEVAK